MSESQSNTIYESETVDSKIAKTVAEPVVLQVRLGSRTAKRECITVSDFLWMGRRAEESGNLFEALRDYRKAYGICPPEEVLMYPTEDGPSSRYTYIR
jgi:hypothetical protein